MLALFISLSLLSQEPPRELSVCETGFASWLPPTNPEGLLGYRLWLDNVELGDIDTTEYQIDTDTLQSNEEYTFSVAAVYTDTISEAISHYLHYYPCSHFLSPQFFKGSYVDENTVELTWTNYRMEPYGYVGGLVTHSGAGYNNGWHVSALHDGLTAYGFNVNRDDGIMVMDKFDTPNGWSAGGVYGFRFYLYQDATPISTLTGVYMAIYDGDPLNGGQLIAGDLETNVKGSTYLKHIYRTSEDDFTEVNRPIACIEADLYPGEIPAGTYWFIATFTGSLKGGVYIIPRTVMGQTTTGEARIYDPENGWQPLLDPGTGTQQGMAIGIIGPGNGGADAISYTDLYRDGELIAHGLDPEEEGFIDYNVPFGIHDYTIVNVYDAWWYDCPNESCPKTIDVRPCYPPENFEVETEPLNDELIVCHLTWDKENDIPQREDIRTFYEIYRKEESQNNFHIVGVLPKDETQDSFEYYDTVSQGTYYYKVSDYNVFPTGSCESNFASHTPPRPVTNFQYEIKSSNRVRFTWDYPENYTPNLHPITWSDCEYYSLIGAATHINWPCAHRFDTEDLQDYVGWRIKAVGFMPTQDRTNYSIRVWKGEYEPELCYDAPVGSDTVLFVMNDYGLSEDIYIEEGKQLWIGFNTDDPYGRYPWAIDDGPAVVGKGDLIWMNDGFTSLGYPYNFIIRAYIEGPNGEQKVLGWESKPMENDLITAFNIYLNGQLFDVIHGDIHLAYDYSCFEDWNMDFAVTAVYGDQESEPVSAHLSWPDDERWFWKVISQPDGYDTDSLGNITISTTEGMAWLLSVVNGYNCNPGSSLNNKTISIVNDIDLSDGLWSSLHDPLWSGFNATIEGNGFTISGLHGANAFISRTDGIVRNLNFSDCEFINSSSGYFSRVGCIASHIWEHAEIDNCHVQNSICASENYCGGLVGEAVCSTIRNCSFSDGIVTSNGTCCGGLVGSGTGVVIENSYFVGDLMRVSGNSTSLGGIIGESNYDAWNGRCRIRNCYSTLLESNVPEIVSGIVGVNKENNIITNCYSIYPQEISLDNQGTIENCAMFDGSGTSWTMSEPVMVGGLQTDDLLTALDHWVTDQTVPDTYFHWVEDTQMTNSGLPIFGELYDGLEDLSNDFGTIIYPNPTTGLLSITTDDFGHAEIYDLTGRLMKQSKQTTIDLGRLPQGLYVVKIFDHSGNSIIRKVIKQ